MAKPKFRRKGFDDDNEEQRDRRVAGHHGHRHKPLDFDEQDGMGDLDETDPRYLEIKRFLK